MPEVPSLPSGRYPCLVVSVDMVWSASATPLQKGRVSRLRISLLPATSPTVR